MADTVQHCGLSAGDSVFGIMSLSTENHLDLSVKICGYCTASIMETHGALNIDI